MSETKATDSSRLRLIAGWLQQEGTNNAAEFLRRLADDLERAKQAAKPKHSPLPEHVPSASPAALTGDAQKLACEAKEALFGLRNTLNHALADLDWCEQAGAPHMKKGISTIDALAALAASPADQAEEAREVCGLKPGCCHKCGLPLSQNPHPEAGKPDHYLEVGCPRECIPCTVKGRHNWASEAMKNQRDAARYRWLRDHESWEPFDSKFLNAHDLYGRDSADMDNAIDAAMSASKEGGA